MSAVIHPLGVRLPPEIKEKIKASAAVNRRSMNAEIVVALEQTYAKSGQKEKADVPA